MGFSASILSSYWSNKPTELDDTTEEIVDEGDAVLV
jgi:hypothetical protein